VSGGRSRIEVLVDGRGVYSWYADAWDQNGGIALVSRGVRPRKLLHEREDERFGTWESARGRVFFLKMKCDNPIPYTSSDLGSYYNT
jgi:hypothetical protein